MPRKNAIVFSALAFAVGGAIALKTFGWDPFDQKVNPLGLDLAVPDALLSTQSLAALPRDILKQPHAKRLLTEDLAFYYEAHEDRLGVLGAIRRIAYEHNVTWSDALLRRVLDEPAQIALWRDSKGALRHYVVSIKRSALTALLEEAGKIALKDTQLTKAGDISTGFGSVPLFALAISPRRTFLMASRGERMVLLSDPGMLLLKDKSIDSKAGAAIARLLEASTDPAATNFAGRAALSTGPVPKHRLAVNAQTFAFGYQKYFPAFEGLQFDLDAQGNVSTALLLDPARTGAQAFVGLPLLQSLPAQPALCALLPVDWNSATILANKAGGTQKDAATGLLSLVQGPAGACWYADSKLHSPVFATKLKDTVPVTTAHLKTLTSWALTPTTEVKGAGAKAGDVPALLSADQVIVFSPDQKLAERVMAVTGKRLASVADSFSGTADKSLTLALVTPSSLAALIRSDSNQSLSNEGEPHLRAAAQRHLWPRLEELAKIPAFKVSLSADALQGERGWRALSWQPLDGK